MQDLPLHLSPAPRPSRRGVFVTVETTTRPATPPLSAFGDDEPPPLEEIVDPLNAPYDDLRAALEQCVFMYDKPYRYCSSAAFPSDDNSDDGSSAADADDEQAQYEAEQARLAAEGAATAERLRNRYEDEGIPPIPREASGRRVRRFQVITNGEKTGILNDWLLAARLVEGYSEKAHKATNNWTEAWEIWRERCLDGSCVPPLHEKSLVGKVVRRPRRKSVTRGPPPTPAPIPPVPPRVHTPALHSAAAVPVTAAAGAAATAAGAVTTLLPTIYSSTNFWTAKEPQTPQRGNTRLTPASSSSSASRGRSLYRMTPTSSPSRSGVTSPEPADAEAYAVICGYMPGAYGTSEEALEARGPIGHIIPSPSRAAADATVMQAQRSGALKFLPRKGNAAGSRA